MRLGYFIGCIIVVITVYWLIKRSLIVAVSVGLPLSFMGGSYLLLFLKSLIFELLDTVSIIIEGM